ncbi:MAG: hypothetical protein IJ449_01820 [Clostridia bacterium]|nr:hypothetical protein [Clostridia bacterium]
MKPFRIVLPLLLCTLLLMLFPLSVSAAEMDIGVSIDGEEVVFDVKPAVVNQRTMVPMRFIFEKLGATVEWIPEENGIRATTDTLEVYLQLGVAQITINGVVTELDVAPYAVDGRTLVPLRAVSEAFSADVVWDQATTSVLIETADGKYAEARDKTASEVFDPLHLRTGLGDFEYADMKISGSRLTVTFKTDDPNTTGFALRFDGGSLCALTDVVTGKECTVTVDLTEYAQNVNTRFEFYTQDKGETSYWSYIYRCLYLERDGGAYRFAASRMWEHNRELLSVWVDPRTYLRDDIDAEIVAMSDDICAGAADDYEKVLMIHDWVAENIYYDYDDYYGKSDGVTEALDVFESKRSVCAGYADLFTTLVQAQGIPCRQVQGYALGLSATGYWTDDNVTKDTANHAWNQVYLDHRWINIDTTWDSDNKYENGEYVYGGIDYHLYFDISSLFLSYNHKILAID